MTVDTLLAASSETAGAGTATAPITPRRSGLVLHPTSLPGPHGIGTLGAGARAFVDFLVAAEQQVWQVLPLGPTGEGNSPYMASSTFAGNPLLIDLPTLCAAGWLDPSLLDEAPASGPCVDFGAVIAHKRRCLAAAWEGFQGRASDEARAAFAEFRRAEAAWLEDFALFQALSEAHAQLPWADWPAALRDREATALEEAREALRDRLECALFEQFCFASQWHALRAYANGHGVSILGDLPIFVAWNSADVWAHRALFYLAADGQPTVVAGVPPDYFAETGQLWGNPLYRWDVLAARDYAWWIDRLRAVLRLCDFVRIDHFRGFESYWEVEAGRENAVVGRWVPGPGRAFFDRVREALGDIPVVAEDLGVITPEVEALRDVLELPGMKVLQFAFGGDSHSPHLPHRHVPRCVVYTGTHDNDTTAGWYAELDPEAADHVRVYLSIDGHDLAWQLLRAAWSSVAELAVAPVQDVLSLGSAARMNMPGVADGNWGWRLGEGQLTPSHAQRLRELTRLYGRSAVTGARR